jgi:hypothetical protein
MSDHNEAVRVLKTLSWLARSGAGVAGQGAFGRGLDLASQGIALLADLLHAGRDPIAVIERVRREERLLAEPTWAEAIAKRWQP